ncbi:MAG: hypothetical protein E7637_05620 [Ruminococcaceae bacterium]|nr:hypothetical protein [Oscillospiraceae bacterium]
MKKWLSLLLAVLMIFTLVSCNLNNEDSEDDGDDDGDSKTVELSRGTIEGDVYANNTIGIRFTKPDDWVYLSETEIAAAMNMGAEMILGKDYKDVLKNVPAVYDMMAKDLVTGSNISVGYENLAKTFSSSITETQYADALKVQLSQVPNMTVTFPDSYDQVTLGDTQFTRVVCTTVAYGKTMTQVYYLHKQGGYMTYVIATLVGDYTVAEFEAMIQ